jgi:hypothetical protein
VNYGRHELYQKAGKHVNLKQEAVSLLRAEVPWKAAHRVLQASSAPLTTDEAAAAQTTTASTAGRLRNRLSPIWFLLSVSKLILQCIDVN